jgi:hypothetical protein
MPNDISDRCNAVEECYEFMLAYAAQGLPADHGNTGSQVRTYLNRAVEALTGMASAYAATIKEKGLEQPQRYDKFIAVIDRDANDSLAAIEVVLTQPSISSQLIDNLNASIHLRALLTDLFLIDEALKLQANAAQRVVTS